MRIIAVAVVFVVVAGCPVHNSGLPPSLRLPAARCGTPPPAAPHVVVGRESLKEEASVEQAPRGEQSGGVLSWPVHGTVVSEFGLRGGRQHDGIEIQASEGTPVRAAADGRIGHVGEIPGLGNTVLIEHRDRMVTAYAHLKEIRGKVGKTVTKGEVIGTVGNSGRVESSSLYFEVSVRSKPKNPLSFLNRQPS